MTYFPSWTFGALLAIVLLAYFGTLNEGPFIWLMITMVIDFLLWQKSRR